MALTRTDFLVKVTLIPNNDRDDGAFWQQMEWTCPACTGDDGADEVAPQAAAGNLPRETRVEQYAKRNTTATAAADFEYYNFVWTPQTQSLCRSTRRVLCVALCVVLYVWYVCDVVAWVSLLIVCLVCTQQVRVPGTSYFAVKAVDSQLRAIEVGAGRFWGQCHTRMCASR